MKIKFKIIKEKNDMIIGKEKQRLIEAIINKLSTMSNKKLYQVLEYTKD